MKNNNPSDVQVNRYENLKNQLQHIGFILQGTITPRTIIKKNSGGNKIFGPYYQWTFKTNGKTTTVNLTPSQAKYYQKAINNYKKLRKITEKMKHTSLIICENSSVGVAKRKSGSMINRA